MIIDALNQFLRTGIQLVELRVFLKFYKNFAEKLNLIELLFVGMVKVDPPDENLSIKTIKREESLYDLIVMLKTSPKKKSFEIRFGNKYDWLSI